MCVLFCIYFIGRLSDTDHHNVRCRIFAHTTCSTIQYNETCKKKACLQQPEKYQPDNTVHVRANYYISSFNTRVH